MEPEILATEVGGEQPTTNRLEDLKKNVDTLHRELLTFEYHVGHKSILEKFKQFLELKVRWKGEHVFELQEVHELVKGKLNVMKKDNTENFGLSPYLLEKIVGLLYDHEEVGGSYIKQMSEMVQAFSSQRSLYLSKFTQLNLALEELNSLTTENNNEKQS